MALFSPPRNKPKIGLTMPRLAVGQPMPTLQTIPEPVDMVGRYSGQVHGSMGDNPNGQEYVSVTPPPGKTNDPAGGPSYSSGGGFLVGSPAGSMDEIKTNPYLATMGTGIFSPNWQPPTAPSIRPPVGWGAGESTQGQVPAGWGNVPIIPPTGTQTYDPSININPNNPNSQINFAEQNTLNQRNAALDMKRAVLDARARALGTNEGIRTAKNRVYDLTSRQNSLNRGLTQQELTEAQRREQEAQGIYSASQNTPDLINVAEATNLQRAEAKRAQQAGVSPAAEVNLPPGYNGPRLPGVTPKIMSQEDRLREKAGYEDPIASARLSAARSAVELQSYDLKEAELQAQRAGMTLDEANDEVRRAELASDYSTLDVSRAQLGEEQAKQPPFAGAEKYTNPQTGEGQWVTPWKAAILRREDQKKLDNDRQGLATKYSDSPYYGAFSVSQLEQMLAQGAGSATVDGVREELIKRGFTPEQANAIVLDANARSNRTRATLTEAVPGQVAVTPQTAPGAAPTGQSSAPSVPSVSVPSRVNPFVR